MKRSERLQAEYVFVERTLGDSGICDRCSATLNTYANACTADLSEPCPGFLAIEQAKKDFAVMAERRAKCHWCEEQRPFLPGSERQQHLPLSGNDVHSGAMCYGSEVYNTRPPVSPDELRTALEESVKLQAHYAELLNMHDGGTRRIFKTADEWIARLREIEAYGKR